MRDWIDVAVLAKVSNMNGRLAVRSTAGLPILLEEGDEVAFVPPQTDLPRRAVVASVRLVDDRSANVEFEGVDGDAASGLVGCHCLMRRDSLDESLFEEEPALWEGWSVVDEKSGMLGAISGFVDNPAQALLEVERADGKGMLLVPVVDEIVLDADVGQRVVRVDLPNGLLDV